MYFHISYLVGNHLEVYSFKPINCSFSKALYTFFYEISGDFIICRYCESLLFFNSYKFFLFLLSVAFWWWYLVFFLSPCPTNLDCSLHTIFLLILYLKYRFLVSFKSWVSLISEILEVVFKVLQSYYQLHLLVL